jgi:hypothetical protein
MDCWARMGPKRLAGKIVPYGERLGGFEGVKIYMTRIDGHAAWVNQAVLDEFAITNETSIEGGSVIDGILIDNAETLVEVPKLSAIDFGEPLAASTR